MPTYLEQYPDVAQAVASGQFGSGYQHYKQYGQAEGRTYDPSVSAITSEDAYLLANPDVAAAVASGQFKSGRQHYDMYGSKEGRLYDTNVPVLVRQKGEEEALFGQFENLQKSQEALPALYQRLEQEAGIPGLQQQASAFKDQIFKVKSLLDRIGEDVTARTTGYNVTEAQRRALEAGESEKLNTQLGQLGTGLAPVADMLSSAQGRLGTMMNLETQEQAQELEPIKMRINALSDRFAREITGFTADREAQLTLMLDKLERERFLSDRDWELAQQLAAEERNFAKQKQLATIQLGSQIKTTAPAVTPKATPAPLRQLPNLPSAAPIPVSSVPGSSQVPVFRNIGNPQPSYADPLGILRR